MALAEVVMANGQWSCSWPATPDDIWDNDITGWKSTTETVQIFDGEQKLVVYHDPDTTGFGFVKMQEVKHE